MVETLFIGAYRRCFDCSRSEGGGVMTHADLAEFESEWVEPISTNYHGFDVFQLPPPGQGWAGLEMLNILEVCAPYHGLNLTTLGPSNPDYWHLMVEAKISLLRPSGIQRRSTFCRCPIRKIIR